MTKTINSHEAIAIARDFLEDVGENEKPQYVGMQDGCFFVLFREIGLTVEEDGEPGDEWLPDEFARVRRMTTDVESL
jgi:hypothetical protein